MTSVDHARPSQVRRTRSGGRVSGRRGPQPRADGPARLPVRSLVIWALVAAALLLVAVTASAPPAAWLLGLTAAVNALVCAGGVRLGASREHEPDRFTGLDAFVMVSALAGTVISGVEVRSGVPRVPQRTMADLAGATHAEVSLTLFVAATIGGWALLRDRPDQPPLAHQPTRSVSYLRAARRTRVVPLAAPHFGPRLSTRWPSQFACVLLILAGTAGLVLRLLLGLRPGALAVTVAQAQSAGVVGLLGTVLAPLIAVGSFLLLMDPTGRIGRGPRFALGLVLAPLSIAALATFGLNRAIFIVPAGVMVLVTLRTRRVARPLPKLAAAMVLAAVFFVFIGQARLGAQRDEYGAVYVPETSSLQLAELSAEVYLQAPYFSGAAYTTRSTVQYDARSLLGSALSPIPRIGAPFRNHTGTALYNRAIGRGSDGDQILPTWAELELSLGVVAMLLAAFAFGAALRLIDRRVRLADNAASAYAWTFLMLWAAQAPIVSVSVIAQILCDFVGPLFVCLLLPGVSGRIPLPPPHRARRDSDHRGAARHI